MRARGIRLPETARPGFDRLPPEEQKAAARRDVEHFIAATERLHRDKQLSLEERLVRLETLVAFALHAIEVLARDLLP